MSAKRRETEDITETEILASKTGISVEETIALENALLSLTSEEREIITLKYLDGFSYDELAEHLEIPRGTVMSRLFHTRKKLQAKLAARFS